MSTGLLVPRAAGRGFTVDVILAWRYLDAVNKCRVASRGGVLIARVCPRTNATVGYRAVYVCPDVNSCVADGVRSVASEGDTVNIVGNGQPWAAPYSRTISQVNRRRMYI